MEMEYEDKFFVWARKIEEEIYHLEDSNVDNDEIVEYLEKCADLREEFLDPDDLTETEEYWTIKIHELFEKYQVIDPIYEAIR